jgi:magnesium chelatase family protein
VNHFKVLQSLRRREASSDPDEAMPDLKDIKGKEIAKRALEVAAAGGHNLLIMGVPEILQKASCSRSILSRRLR